MGVPLFAAMGDGIGTIGYQLKTTTTTDKGTPHFQILHSDL